MVRMPLYGLSLLLCLAAALAASSAAAAPAGAQETRLCLTAEFEKRHLELLKQRAAEGSRFALRCHYATNDQAAQTRPVAAPYVNAADPSGNVILMNGRAEDGFFVPETIASYRRDGSGRRKQVYPVSRDAMEQVCIDTIASGVRGRVPPGEPYLWSLAAQVYPPDSPWEKGWALRFPQDEKQIVIFGDSVSDNGNLYYFLASRLLGLYTLPDRPYFFGQFTNRFVWNEYLTRPSRTEDGSRASGLVDAALLNLSYGGMVSGPGVAGILPPPWDFVDRIVVAVQVAMAGNARDMVAAYVESLSGHRIRDPGDTIFVIFFGANDFDNHVNKRRQVLLFRRPRGPFGYKTLSDAGVADHVAAAERLLAAGARNLLIVDVPNLGITPMVLLADGFLKHNRRLTPEQKHYLLSRELTRATGYYNRRLSEEVRRLAWRHPRANIVEYRTNETFAAIFAGKVPGTDEDFDYGMDTAGLKVVLDPPPCVPGDPITIFERCYKGDYDVPCQGEGCVCPAVGRAPYWDPEHPTSYLHCWVGYFVQRALHESGMLDAPPPDMDTYKKLCEELND